MKAVIVALATYCDADGYCFPSIATVAENARLSERGCQAALRELEDAGFLICIRGTGRGNPSKFYLQFDRDDGAKGAHSAPFERVKEMHPFEDEKVIQMHPLVGERVQNRSIKGAPRAPELVLNYPVPAKQKFRRQKPIAKSRNPRIGDPPEAWFDLTTDRSVDAQGITRPAAGSYFLDEAAQLVAIAARIQNPNWRGDWKTLVTWIAEGLDLDKHILPGIRRVSGRASYHAPNVLAYFDAAIRETAGGVMRRGWCRTYPPKERGLFP